MVAMRVAEVLFVAVKAGTSPVPLAASPMFVLLLVHVKVVPGVGPVSGVAGAVAPLQKA
jgi:hypothetical protein